MASKKKSKIVSTGNDEEKDIWTAHESKSGRIYYFNHKTKESRWTPPPIDGEKKNESLVSSGQDNKNLMKKESRRKSSKKLETTVASSSTTGISDFSAVSKRKLAEGNDDLDGNNDDYLNRSKKKRLSNNPDVQSSYVSSSQTFSTSTSKVNFSFKLPPQQQTNNMQLLSFGTVPAIPMDTSSFGSIEDEIMPSVPGGVSSTSNLFRRDDVVELMEVDEIVEGVNLFRRDVASNFTAIVPLVNENGNDYEISLARQDAGRIMIVVDTNILLSDLSFVRDLEDRSQIDLVRIVVPYVVLRELDWLKEDRSSILKEGKQSALSKNARAAISWIHDQLTKGPNTNVIFQPSRADQNVLAGFKITCNDDRILKCVMEINSQRDANDQETLTILCTNDKNLLNKGRIDGLHCASKKELESFLQRRDEESASSTTTIVLPQIIPVSSVYSNISAVTPVKSYSSTTPVKTYLDQSNSSATSHGTPFDPYGTSQDISEIDEIMNSCKDLLTKVVENEMNEALGKEWIHIVKVKPPWRTLADVLNIFLQHWRAVFSYLFMDKQAEEEVKKLHTDARHAITFGSRQFQRSDTMTRLLRLLKIIQQKRKVYAASINSISERIEHIVTSTS